MTSKNTFLNGILIKRYKRFFADVQLDNNVVTAHCPNTGSMMGLLDAGNKVLLSKSDNEKRKLKYTLEVIKLKKSHVGVNTHRTNRIVEKALNDNVFNFVKSVTEIRREVKYGENSKVDFVVTTPKEEVYIEVKNVTLSRDKKTAEFPDAITTRGSKHLLTLIDAIKKGYKTYLIFLIQIQNMENFKIAKDIDIEYYKNYLAAKNAGVNFLAYRCKISLKEILIEKKLKIIDV